MFEGFREGLQEKIGQFTVDKFAGKDTSFKLYFTSPVESYVKYLALENDKGRLYNTVMDNRMSLHYLSVYGAPLDQV